MEEEILKKPDGPVEVVDIQFRPGQKVYFLIPTASPTLPVTTSLSTPPGAPNTASVPAATIRFQPRMW